MIAHRLWLWQPLIQKFLYRLPGLDFSIYGSPVIPVAQAGFLFLTVSEKSIEICKVLTSVGFWATVFQISDKPARCDIRNLLK